jgi:hypothetical protein
VRTAPPARPRGAEGGDQRRRTILNTSASHRRAAPPGQNSPLTTRPDAARRAPATATRAEGRRDISDVEQAVGAREHEVGHGIGHRLEHVGQTTGSAGAERVAQPPRRPRPGRLLDAGHADDDRAAHSTNASAAF